MAKRDQVADALDELALELDEQREATEQRHKETMAAIEGVRVAIGHWVDDYNQNRSHVQDQFRKEGEAILKLQREVAALQLAGGNGSGGE